MRGYRSSSVRPPGWYIWCGRSRQIRARTFRSEGSWRTSQSAAGPSTGTALTADLKDVQASTDMTDLRCEGRVHGAREGGAQKGGIHLRHEAFGALAGEAEGGEGEGVGKRRRLEAGLAGGDG